MKGPETTAARVLVVGDVMLDRYWIGDVSRISPEATVPVVLVDGEERRLGGAANVAGNCAALGARTRLLSVVGADPEGKLLETLLKKEGIEPRLHRDRSIKTTQKLRVIARQQRQQLLRVDFEVPPSREVLASKLTEFRSALKQCDIVILSDYGKGGLTHVAKMIAMARRAGKPVLVDPKGDDYSRYAGATIVTPNNNELRQFVGSWKDESDLERRAQALAVDQAQLRELLGDAELRELLDRESIDAVERELQRRRFVTFVTHQLKTPLVAVHQFLDLMQRLEETPDAAAKRSEWLARCLVRTEELQRLIEEWLTLARLEGGTLGRQRIRVDVRPLVATVLESYRTLAASREVSLAQELPEDACPVHGDPICLTVLLDNLVTNAIQYNRPGGRVGVCARRAPGEVVITVEDTGAGIPRDALPFLFDEFFRVRRPGNHSRGTGLGLHICRRIVTEMGGTIEVESTEGAGSTFRVRLPLYAAPGGGEAGPDEHVA